MPTHMPTTGPPSSSTTAAAGPKQAHQFIVTPPPGFIPPALEQTLSSEDIEDIPVYLALGLDPFMSIAVAINDVQTERTRSRLAEIRKPRSARTKLGSAASRREPGFSEVVANELGLAPSERPASAPWDSGVGRLAAQVGMHAAQERLQRLELLTNPTTLESRRATIKSAGAGTGAGAGAGAGAETGFVGFDTVRFGSPSATQRPQASGLLGTTKVPNI